MFGLSDYATAIIFFVLIIAVIMIGSAVVAFIVRPPRAPQEAEARAEGPETARA